MPANGGGTGLRSELAEPYKALAGSGDAINGEGPDGEGKGSDGNGIGLLGRAGGDRRLQLALLAGPVVAFGLVVIGGFGGALAGLSVGGLLVIVVAVPVLEELAFRGLVQGLLLEHSWAHSAVGPVTAANAITAGAFSLVHVPRGGVILCALVLGPGLLFGYFRERYRSVAIPAFLHSYYNACLCAAVWLAATPPT
jgi:membrane protease YdiL (CAAX protease family)